MWCRWHSLSVWADPSIPSSKVSTSAVLVEGLYQGAVRVSRLLRHGDVGLSTFIDLDGEMVVLEGVCNRVVSDGGVMTVEGDRIIPYAVVTRFNSEFVKRLQYVNIFAELATVCNGQRKCYRRMFAEKSTCPSTPERLDS